MLPSLSCQVKKSGLWKELKGTFDEDKLDELIDRWAGHS
jgi:hypothetical protein